MRLFQRVLLGVFLALAPAIAHAQVTFNGVGGPYPSAVRDATRVGTDIYAVGGAGPDATLWTWNGTSFVLTTLPTFVPISPIPPGSSGVAAFAITPDGAYIATQARVPSTNLVATRVSRSDLNYFDLGFLNLGVPGITAAARAISGDGQILYGVIGNPPSTPSRTAQYDNGLTRLIPQFLSSSGLPLSNQPIFRGTSSDGLTMVGTNGSGTGPSAGRTFRYDSLANTNALIPLPAGASFNSGMGVSPDGNLALLSMGGNSLFTKGEVYIHNASTDAITLLGSPNPAWATQGFAGMTADGAVVATSFNFPTSPLAATTRAGYFHNANGWFDLMSALAKGGVDIVSTAGWSQLFVFGMSADGTLVYGRGVHDTNLADGVPGNLEGFVAAFPVNFLNNFSAPPVPPANTALVGAWLLSVNPSNPGNPPVMVFLADGTFFLIETVPSSSVTGGFERGTYSWNAGTGAFAITTLHSTKGDYGFSEANGALGMTLVITGDNATFHAPDGDTSATRIFGGASNLVGGWFLPDPGAATPDPSDDFPAVLVLLSDGTYYLAQDGEPEPGGHPGIEKGTYSWSPAGVPLAGPFSGTPNVVDTDGVWGFSNPSGVTTLALAPDGLVATATDDAGSFSITRIVDPNMVAPAITSDLSLTGTVGTPFITYMVTTAYPALTVNAAPLPAGLLVNAATGEVSGTPTESGIFAVTITASNTLATRTAVLSLIVGTSVTTTDTPASGGLPVLVQPTVPPGAAPVDITFDNVTSGGDTTLAIIDPTSIDPGSVIGAPAGFNPATDPAIYYEVTTTAQFDGFVTLCFNYGTAFGTATPRLFHYDGGLVPPAWVDVTTSVDTTNHIICGATDSFSPFLIYAPPNGAPLADSKVVAVTVRPGHDGDDEDDRRDHDEYEHRRHDGHGWDRRDAREDDDDDHEWDHDADNSRGARITLSATDTDSQTMTFRIVTPPAHGILSRVRKVTCTPDATGGASCTGVVVYIPEPHNIAPDSFTYVANDGHLDSNVATVTINLVPPFTTFTQGAWGSSPHGGNPGFFLKTYFSVVYGGAGVTVGSTKALKFTTSNAIDAFLPAGGKAAALPASSAALVVNPASSKGGIFAGHVLALKLNVDFSNSGKTRTGLATMLVSKGPLKPLNLTVAQVLAMANAVLGGSAVPPAGLSLSDFSETIEKINQNFDSGKKDEGFLKIP